MRGCAAAARMAGTRCWRARTRWRASGGGRPGRTLPWPASPPSGGGTPRGPGPRLLRRRVCRDRGATVSKQSWSTRSAWRAPPLLRRMPPPRLRRRAGPHASAAASGPRGRRRQTPAAPWAGRTARTPAWPTRRAAAAAGAAMSSWCGGTAARATGRCWAGGRLGRSLSTLVLAASSARSSLAEHARARRQLRPLVRPARAPPPCRLRRRPAQLPHVPSPPPILVSSCSSCCSSHLRVSDQTHALLRELRNPAGAHIILETERRPAAADAEGGEHRRGGSPRATAAGQAGMDQVGNRCCSRRVSGNVTEC